MPLNHFQKAFILMCISSLAGALIAVSMKALSFHLSIAVIFFFTRVFILVGALLTILKHKKSLLKSENKIKIVIISIFYIVAMYCYLYSLTMIPMSISSVFANSAPLYVPLLAYFIVDDDSIKSKKLWLCMMVSFLGICLILMPMQKMHASFFGMIIAFLSGLFLAFWQVLTKKTTANESPQKIAFFQMIASIVFTAIPAVYIISLHGVNYLNGLWTIKNMSMLVLAGICSWIYQLYRTQAMSYAPVSFVMPFGYLGVVFVGLFDFIFWNMVPHWISVVGILLVMSGVVMLLRVSNTRPPTLKFEQ